MAKKHVINYYLQQELQYIEALKNLKEFQTLAKENLVTSAEYEKVMKETQLIKDSYMTLSYIMFLLNKPNRKSSVEDKKTQEWYKTLSGYSKEALLDESKDALANFKEIINNVKVRKVEEDNGIK